MRDRWAILLRVVRAISLVHQFGYGGGSGVESGGRLPINMVKTRITASRRLRAQVKKHQKSRRGAGAGGGGGAFTPRLRELNSGDAPWSEPCGKSKLLKNFVSIPIGSTPTGRGFDVFQIKGSDSGGIR